MKYSMLWAHRNKPQENLSSQQKVMLSTRFGCLVSTNCSRLRTLLCKIGAFMLAERGFSHPDLMKWWKCPYLTDRLFANNEKSGEGVSIILQPYPLVRVKRRTYLLPAQPTQFNWQKCGRAGTLFGAVNLPPSPSLFCWLELHDAESVRARACMACADWLVSTTLALARKLGRWLSMGPLLTWQRRAPLHLWQFISWASGLQWQGIKYENLSSLSAIHNGESWLSIRDHLWKSSFYGPHLPWSACPNLVFSDYLHWQQVICVSDLFRRAGCDAQSVSISEAVCSKSSVVGPTLILKFPKPVSGLPEPRIRRDASHSLFLSPGWCIGAHGFVIGVQLQKVAFLRL